MRKLIYIGIFFFCSVAAMSQKNTLSGIVYDSKSGETLIGATVYLTDKTSIGTITDINGFFNLSNIDKQNVQVKVTFIGYEDKLVTIDFSESREVFIEIKLKSKSFELEGVDIVELSSLRVGDREIETSQHSLTPKTIQSIPTARNDVFKAIKFLPGIEATEPLSPLVSVRGSDPGENLIMLDGVTVYNPYHFMSSAGMFNMQTIKNVDMLVGGFGAEYGGRNSSVVHLTTKDGTQDGLHGEVQPTIVESKVFLEFPVDNKTTMMLAGRFNYDIIGNFVFQSNNYFYDANVSLTHRFNSKNRLDIKYFGSKDHTSISFNSFYKYLGYTFERFGDTLTAEAFTDMDFAWENQWNNNIATAIWKLVISPKIYFRIQAYSSMHSANNTNIFRFDVEDVYYNTSANFRSKISDYTAKTSISYTPFFGNQIKLGAEYSRYHFANEYAINNIDGEKASANPQLLALFLEDKIKAGRLIIRPGVRMSAFNGRSYKTEPRINMVFSLGKGWNVKAAYGHYYQYIISMNTQELELNQFLDYYYPLMKSEPGYSIHYIAGVEKKLNYNNKIFVDIYYKDIVRTYIFDLMQSEYEAFAFSDKVFEGTGESYGMEILWKGNIDRFSGWASYTISRSTRSFPNIMNGKSYLYDYDRLHTLKGVVNYQATKRISYSADFLFQSGMPRSVENTFQFFYDYNPVTGQMLYSPQYTIDTKNSSRMPWIMSLNLGLKKEVVKGFGKDISDFFKADESYLLLNVQNVLFLRRNISYYLPVLSADFYIPLGFDYFPMVSVGYTIKF